jgi:pimeloyl-ACP methyl ester carboxylesterase
VQKGTVLFWRQHYPLLRISFTLTTKTPPLKILVNVLIQEFNRNEEGNVATDRTNQQIRLKDGRILGYAEYGAPDGKPVFYFHGHPGSRLDWLPFDDDDIAAELKARIIAVDRPGTGLSDFKRGREILDWPDDVIEMADALKVDRFAALGISGGGPYAAACAFKIPKRLTATAIVSGMGPAEAPGMKDGIGWKFAAGRSSVMRRLMLMLMSYGLRKKPDKFISSMKETLKGPDGVMILDKPELLKGTMDNFSEAFRSGIAGVHHEAGLYRRPWGFRLQDITAEVHLWHGEQDDNVPVSVGRYVADAIPNCRAKFIEN